eukprot:scaffold539_cov359-Prasinococcus_capsulatus_cf.AAC.2
MAGTKREKAEEEVATADDAAAPPEEPAAKKVKTEEAAVKTEDDEVPDKKPFEPVRGGWTVTSYVCRCLGQRAPRWSPACDDLGCLGMRLPGLCS